MEKSELLNPYDYRMIQTAFFPPQLLNITSINFKCLLF